MNLKSEKTDQIATQRIFKLIERLRRSKCTIKQLETYVGVSDKTIYKYIKLVKNFFNVRTEEGCYFIADSEDVGAKSLIDEERVLIQNALSQYAPNNPLRQDIIQKLFIRTDFTPLADSLIREQDVENLRQLTEALRTKKRVLLRGYQSDNSNRLSDRVFEPKTFYEDYWQVHGCELNSARTISKTKTFNLERISNILILDETQSFQLDEEIKDFFGWSGTERRTVDMRLTKRAKLALEKQHPATRSEIKDDGGGKFRIRTSYTGLEHLSRFILSLPGEIEVLHDSFLREYLNQQCQLLDRIGKMSH